MDNNNKRKNRRSPIGVIVALIGIITVTRNIGGFFDMGGIAFFLPVVFIVSIIFAVTGAVTNAKKQSSSSAYRPVYPQNPSTRRTSSLPQAQTRGHLCDEGQHPLEASEFDAMEEMEPGYRSRGSIGRMGESVYPPAAAHRLRSRRLTPEELNRKQAELRDLLSAGIITREEYNAKLNEYRN